MRTGDLIQRLSLDADAPRSMVWTLALGLAVGAAVSFAWMMMWLGPRPDLSAALGTTMFWMKLAYPLVLGALAVPLVLALARPAGTLPRVSWLLLAPVLALALLGVVQWTQATPDARMPLVMGSSMHGCTVLMALLSLPVLASLLLSLRRLAPTKLVAAGAATGLLAGAAGAAIYALHCTETGAPFVAVWYTLGMVWVGVLGGLIGRWTLRW